MYLGLIIFFAFFYTAIVFNPDETADNLKKHGGFLPASAPARTRPDYLDYVLTRLTVIGAAYLCAVCVLPENPDLAIFRAVLFRRHLAADRRVGHDGHGVAGALASSGPSV
jgi:preprotein translocase subunit SecY